MVDNIPIFVEEKKDVQKEGLLRLEDMIAFVNALKQIAMYDRDPAMRGKAMTAIARIYQFRTDFNTPEAVNFLMARKDDADTTADRVMALGILTERYLHNYVPSRAG